MAIQSVSSKDMKIYLVPKMSHLVQRYGRRGWEGRHNKHSTKLPAADIADIIFFFCMRCQMSFEMLGPIELSFACWAADNLLVFHERWKGCCELLPASDAPR